MDGELLEDWDGNFSHDLHLESDRLELKLDYNAMACRITLSYKDLGEKVIASTSYTYDIFAALVLSLREFTYLYGQMSANITGCNTVEKVNALADFYNNLVGSDEEVVAEFDDGLDLVDLAIDLDFKEKACRHLIEALIAVGEYEHQSSLRSDQMRRNFDNLRAAHHESARSATRVAWERQDLHQTFEHFIALIDRHFTAGGRVIGRHQLHQMLADAIAPKSTDDYMTTEFLDKYFVDRPAAPTA